MLALPYEKIVVPVDFSDASIRTVELVRQVMDEASTLHVVTVLEYQHIADPVSVWGDTHDADRVKKSEAFLNEKIGEHRADQVVVRALVGSPALEIVEYAKEAGADLIALPTHGRTGAERMFIGSVAERVARLAHCPVLILRLPKA